MNRRLFDHALALDRTSMLWMSRRRRPFATTLLKIVTYSGEGKTWITLAVALNLLELSKIDLIPEQSVFLRSMLCALLAYSLGIWIKKRIKRPRPEETIVDFKAAIQRPACHSFPSSHASSTVALFMALTLSHHALAPTVGIWAVAVTFSRFYLGVHFPSDLFGGIILGVTCGLCIFPIGFIIQNGIL